MPPNPTSIRSTLHLLTLSSAGQMCGILCCIDSDNEHSLSKTSESLLRQRGPDSTQRRTAKLASSAELSQRDVTISFFASVLCLRGETLVTQPAWDQISGSVLCWNGEAWEIDKNAVRGNDTGIVFEMLLRASRDDCTPDGNPFAMTAALSRICGPFAFVFYDAPHQKLYLGRDPLGRRSLLRAVTANGSLLVASVADLTIAAKWSEVEADGVYVVDLQHNQSNITPNQLDMKLITSGPQCELNTHQLVGGTGSICA